MPRRRLLAAGAAGAAVAIIAGTLAVWQPWSAGDGSTSHGHLPARLVLDAPGLTLRSSSVPGDPAQQAAEPAGVVFASASSTLDGGPLLALLESDTAGERGMRAAAIGTGMTAEQITAFERATTLDDGVVTVADSAVLVGLQPAGDMATLRGLVEMASPFGSPAALANFGGGTGGAVGVEYSLPSGDTVTLSSIDAPTSDAGLLAGMLLDHEHATTVGDLPAIVGDVVAGVGQPPRQRMLVWRQGGRLLALVAGADDERLVQLAGTARPATAAQWAAVEAVRFNGPAFAAPPAGSAPAVSVGNPAQP